MRFSVFFACVGLVAASGHDDDGDDAHPHRNVPSVYGAPSGYAAEQPTSSATATWTGGYGGDDGDHDDDDDDDYEPPPVPAYTKPPAPVCTPTTFYETKTIPTTVHYANTIATTLSVPVYVTSLTSAPAVTVYITTTLVETDVYPTTVTATETTTTSQCDFCKIDIYATALTFPTTYVPSTVYATTYDVYTTVYEASNQTVYSTNTILAPTTCIETPVTTWVYSGVVLTSGSTYLAYTNISRGFLEPRPTVFGCGELVSVPLDLGPAASQINQLIDQTAVIPTTVVPAPARLLSYLDTIPTVVAQLPPGVPIRSCDTPQITSVDFNTPTPQVTMNSATTVPGATRRDTMPLVIANMVNIVSNAVANMTVASAIIHALS